MTTPPPDSPVPQPAAPDPVPSSLADWGTRAIGLIIDWLPILIINVVTYWSGLLRPFGGLVGIAYVAYLGHLEGVTGQTPGKAIQGTRLVNQQGQLIGSGAGIGRKFCHILDNIVCFLGWFLPLVDAKRQTIADKVMSTFVVTGVEKKAFAVELWMPPKPATPPSASQPPQVPPPPPQDPEV